MDLSYNLTQKDKNNLRANLIYLSSDKEFDKDIQAIKILGTKGGDMKLIVLQIFN